VLRGSGPIENDRRKLMRGKKKGGSKCGDVRAEETQKEKGG